MKKEVERARLRPVFLMVPGALFATAIAVSFVGVLIANHPNDVLIKSVGLTGPSPPNIGLLTTCADGQYLSLDAKNAWRCAEAGDISSYRAGEGLTLGVDEFTIAPTDTTMFHGNVIINGTLTLNGKVVTR